MPLEFQEHVIVARAQECTSLLSVFIFREPTGQNATWVPTGEAHQLATRCASRHFRPSWPAATLPAGRFCARARLARNQGWTSAATWVSFCRAPKHGGFLLGSLENQPIRVPQPKKNTHAQKRLRLPGFGSPLHVCRHLRIQGLARPSDR